MGDEGGGEETPQFEEENQPADQDQGGQEASSEEVPQFEG